jgi:hypothetical protein
MVLGKKKEKTRSSAGRRGEKRGKMFLWHIMMMESEEMDEGTQ